MHGPPNVSVKEFAWRQLFVANINLKNTDVIIISSLVSGLILAHINSITKFISSLFITRFNIIIQSKKLV